MKPIHKMQILMTIGTFPHLQNKQIKNDEHDIPGDSENVLVWTSNKCLKKFANTCSMHQMYSSSVSPFQAYTGTPRLAIAAAAWSCVEKMLQLDHWTWKYYAEILRIRVNKCHTHQVDPLIPTQLFQAVCFEQLWNLWSLGKAYAPISA